jgi:hypothetical protein
MKLFCIKYVAATVRAGGSETDRGGLMRQKCFLVDALARLALNWKTDRGDWR